MSAVIPIAMRQILLETEIEVLSEHIECLTQRARILSGEKPSRECSKSPVESKERKGVRREKQMEAATSPTASTPSSPPEFIPNNRITYPPCSSPLYPFNPSDHPSPSAKSLGPSTIAHLSPICNRLGLKKFTFQHVDSSYYEWPLEKRADVLRAPSIHHLCKSIVMENIRWGRNEKEKGGEGEGNEMDAKEKEPRVSEKNSNSVKECVMTVLPSGELVDEEGFTSDGHYLGDPLNPRYILVIVQYSAKLHREKLVRAVYRYISNIGEKDKVLSKNRFNWRLCEETVNDRLSGYSHNSVTPVGMKNEVLFVMSHRIHESLLEGGYFWLGGGHVDVKWRNDINEFREVFKPIVADITY